MKTYTLQEAQQYAKDYLNSMMISFDDLPDVESPELKDGMTEKEIIQECKTAYNETFFQTAEEMGFYPDDIDAMLEIM